MSQKKKKRQIQEEFTPDLLEQPINYVPEDSITIKRTLRGPQGPHGLPGVTYLEKLKDILMTTTTPFRNIVPPGLTGPPYNGDILKFDDELKAWVNAPGEWDDMMVPVFSTLDFGPNTPKYQQFTNGAGSYIGLVLPTFSPNTMNEIYFTAQFPHSYKENSNIFPHLHIVPMAETGITSTIRFGMEYSWVSIWDKVETTSFVYGEYIFQPSMKNQHTILSFNIDSDENIFLTGINGTGKRISSQIFGRVFRDVDSEIDTYTGEIALMEFDVHYRHDSMGSVELFRK